jgi:hypothetical protein
MKPGDLILATSHSYPLDYKRGEAPLNYSRPTPVIFLEQFPEGGSQPRIFYRIITPSNGIHNINSLYCREVAQ